MKAFCYFVEPAAYTLDLASNVYEINNINYCFIKSTSLVKADETLNNISLDDKSFLGRMRFILDIFKNNDFIIINGYNNYPFILTFIFNLFTSKKKYIATESDTQLNIPNNLIKRLFKFCFLSFVFKNKYVLGFAGGSKSHKDLFRCYGMSEERIFLMPMMVNNDKFFQEKKQFPNIFTFLYVGRLVKHKNVDGLINQFNRNFSNKNAILKIIGSGEEELYLKHKYESDQVIFLGKQYNDYLINEYKSASCFVCPSLFEPWGLVVNEALSAGLPVIATKEVGATADLIAGKGTGFIVDDMNDIGNKMVQLFKDPELLRKYSNNASDLMQSHWNYNLYKNNLQEVLKSINK